jgi:hypothetical protein
MARFASAVRDDSVVDLRGELVDGPRDIGVRVELLLRRVEVVVGLGLLEGRLAVWPIITKVDRKMASSDTMSVSVGQGLASMNSIQAGTR